MRLELIRQLFLQLISFLPLKSDPYLVSVWGCGPFLTTQCKDHSLRTVRQALYQAPRGMRTLRRGASPCIGGFENFALVLSSGMFLGLSWGAEACRSTWEYCRAGHVTEGNRNPTA